MSKRVILLVAFATFLFQGLGRANDGLKLTGSTLKAKDILSKADVVFIGRIIAMGYEENPPATESPDFGSHYHGVTVQYLQVLQGSIGTQTSVALFIYLLQEKLPAVGSSYIFFIRKNGQIAPHNPDPFDVLKLLPATDDNIAKVKKLISN